LIEWRRKGDKLFIGLFTRAYLIKEKEESGLVVDYGLKPTEEPTLPDLQKVFVQIRKLKEKVPGDRSGNTGSVGRSTR
jgi:hypothetical protein